MRTLTFVLAGFAVWLTPMPALAQLMGTTGGGAGGAGGGQAGSGSTGAFSSGFGSQQGQGGTGGNTSGGTTGGTTGFSGNLNAPTAFGQTTGSTTTITSVPTTANPFQSFYSNPRALGMQLTTLTTMSGTQNSNVIAFGQPLYATTNTGAVGGGFGGAGGVGGAAGGIGTQVTGTLGNANLGYGALSSTTSAFGGVGGVGGAGGTGTAAGGGVSLGVIAGFSTVGTSRAVPYVTSLDFTPTRAAATVGSLQADLQQVVARSSFLTSRNIQVIADGGALVMRGEVRDDRERRFAEGLLRLTPGVRDLRNELVVRP